MASGIVRKAVAQLVPLPLAAAAALTYKVVPTKAGVGVRVS